MRKPHRKVVGTYYTLKLTERKRGKEMETAVKSNEQNVDHPCFDKEASKTYGRMHLPVAPRCNISCNYCNRKYDCANETRPGVTSRVLSPEVAYEKFSIVKEKRPEITTIGIAGPGDSLANAERTFKTLEFINNGFPDTNLCLSTNGLLLPEYVDDLVRVNAKYITVTINAVDPIIGGQVYRSVRYQGKNNRNEDGAAILLENQLKGLKLMQERGGFTVKVNTVLLPGINDHHIREIAEVVKGYGVSLFNVTGHIPVEGSVFSDRPEPTYGEVIMKRMEVDDLLPMMSHCSQCRSDACGILGEDEQHDEANQIATVVQTKQLNAVSA